MDKDRRGTLTSQILTQQDFDLPAGFEVYLGGMYRVVDGLLAVPADDATQNNCVTVYALQRKSNAKGVEREARARCMIRGIAHLPVGGLGQGSVGKPVYPTADDAIAATTTQADNLPVGTLLRIDGALAVVQLA